MSCTQSTRADPDPNGASWTSARPPPTPATSPSAWVSWATSRPRPAAASSPASSTPFTDNARRRAGREVHGFVDRRHPPSRRPRRRRPGSCRGPGPLDRHEGAGAAAPKSRKRVEPVVDHVQVRLGDIPERLVQVIEPVAAKVRGLTGSRGVSSQEKYRARPALHSGRARSSCRRCRRCPFPQLDSCAPCRRARSSPSSTPATTTSSTGCTSPPISIPSPTRSPARRTRCRAGDSKARRSPPSTHCSRYDVPTWFRLGDKDIATHLFRTQRLNAGATLSEVTAEITRAWDLDLRLVPMTDDRVRTRITVTRDGGRTEEIADAAVVRR